MPFPRSSGQQQRVYYTLRAARERFHVTFASVVAAGKTEETRQKLLETCDDVVLLTSRYARGKARRAWHRLIGAIYGAATGLKFSNYVLGKLEFAPARVAALINGNNYDCVLYEYWHAWESTANLRAAGIPTVLDTHNVLWESYRRHLDSVCYLPNWWKRWKLERYKKREKQAWAAFDGLVAINREEYKVIRKSVPQRSHVFYAPMGIDLAAWPYTWQASDTVRIAYYGGLGSPRNQKAALQCFHSVMPEIWKAYPAAELWLVGSNPPDSLKQLEADSRVKVTGFVENVQDTLRSMSVVVCPFEGTYGFRSRLVEVMALGVPLVTSHDAVDGMELQHEKGLLLAHNEYEMTRQTLTLLKDPAYASKQSRLGRQQVEQMYSVKATYGQLIEEICRWLPAGRSDKR